MLNHQNEFKIVDIKSFTLGELQKYLIGKYILLTNDSQKSKNENYYGMCTDITDDIIVIIKCKIYDVSKEIIEFEPSTPSKKFLKRLSGDSIFIL